MPWLTLLIACVLSLLTPIIVIAVRHEVRLRRIRMIDEFDRTFDGTGNLSLEFVKAKYSIDLDPIVDGVDRIKLRNLDLTDEAVDRYLAGLRWWQLESNRKILAASAPYMLLCLFGFFVSLAPVHTLVDETTLVSFVQPFMLAVGGLDPTIDSARYLENVMTIAAVTFLGAYVFTLRLFIRAVAVFDFSSITMLRATMQIIVGVVSAVLIYRAMPDLTAPLQWVVGAVGAGKIAADPLTLASPWYIAAFLFGFVPDAAVQFLFNKLKGVVGSIKTMDDSFTEQSRSIPLDVIDGIDFFTRFRLEEANVFEVQNLACANPIMLFIETPYGIYQTIDWVAQAQLCIIVGHERFLMFRQYSIRTIFDLERAVLSRSSTAQLRRMIGGILLQTPQIARELDAVSGGSSATPPAYAGLGGGTPGPVGLGDLQRRIVNLFAEPASTEDPDRTLKHLVRVMVDDLHVDRLREIWERTVRKLGKDAEALDDSEEPPTAMPLHVEPRAA